MPRSDRLLIRAIGLLRAGKKADARILLAVILREEPRNQLARAWSIEACETDAERMLALQDFLGMFPGHSGAQARLLALQALEQTRLTQEAARAQAENDVLRLRLEDRKSAVVPDRGGRRSLLPFIFILLALLGLSLFGLLGAWGRVGSLGVEVEHLSGENSSLSESLRALQTRLDVLSAEYTIFKQQAVAPPYISVQGRNIRMAFYGLDQSLILWELPFDTYEYYSDLGYEARQSIQVNQPAWLLQLEYDNGQVFNVIDYTHFVEPDTFSTVMTNLYRRSESPDLFIREVWNLTNQLTVYSSEITDTPRYPLETLVSGGGDCEDTSILFASLILASSVDWDVQLVYMDIDNPTMPVVMNHMIVAVDTGVVNYLVETTSKTEMTPYPSVRGWYYHVK